MVSLYKILLVSTYRATVTYSEGHFQLQTLYCSDALDIGRIFKSQTELQIFGMYNLPRQGFLQSLRIAQLSGLSLPVVFSFIYTKGFEMGFDRFAIFPTFYSADRNATNHQILVDLSNKDLTHEEMKEVTHVYLYMNPSNMPAIHALAKDMAVIFPQIVNIYLVFEYRCEIAPQEIKDVLSMFSNLKMLNVDLRRFGRDLNSTPEVPEQVMVANVKEWKVACPQLTSVTLRYGLDSL